MTQFWQFNDLDIIGIWKHASRKRRKCWIPAFPPFCMIFSSPTKQISIFQSGVICHPEMLWVCTGLGFCSLVKSLSLSQTINFRFYQTERLCISHFHILWKCQKVLKTSRKHCGKRRNCSLLYMSFDHLR